MQLKVYAGFYSQEAHISISASKEREDVRALNFIKSGTFRVLGTVQFEKN
jgi:hypothetical protein